LECTPLKVSEPISSGANFGEHVHTKLCSALERGPRKWAVALELVGRWIGYQVFKKKKEGLSLDEPERIYQ